MIYSSTEDDEKKNTKVLNMGLELGCEVVDVKIQK